MKGISILAAFLLLSACHHQPFCGMIVCKEYIQYHLEDQRPNIIQEASFVPHPVIVPYVHHHHEPQFVPSQWLIYVANKDAVRQFNVDSLSYLYYKVGDKVTF